MRLALHTIICCCVITAVLPVPVEDAAGDASLKKRIRAWLQNCMKTDLDVAASDKHADAAEVQQLETVKPTSPPSSSGLNVRPRRAAALKAPGCFIFACVYHNLLSRLDHFASTKKTEVAPEKRLLPSGYGRRRRRSLEDGTETPLEAGDRDSEEALSPCRYNICTMA